jgi:3'-5' exoribonuclease
MMRVAKQIAPLYPELNLDLLLAGILFHDSGKLWENALPENGFVMNYDELGELMGHISIGLEMVNALWRRLRLENADTWRHLSPASEDVRMHLLHLIGAHHGEPEFGSPVAPKTPEAMALHYIDNLDARLEMFAAGYTTAKPLALAFSIVCDRCQEFSEVAGKISTGSKSTPVRTNFCDALRAHANRPCNHLVPSHDSF